jgi:hypothetical protein
MASAEYEVTENYSVWEACTEQLQMKKFSENLK